MNPSNTAAAEKDLIERVKTNRQAFLEIYDRHFKRIYDYAYYRTMNQAEAEEITSQTFLAALESIERFEYRNIPVIVWLYRIASNTIIDYYRKSGQTVELNEEQTAAGENSQPEVVFLGNSEKKQLLEHLKTLPPVQEQAIILRYIQNLSYKEIAQILDKSEGAVKQLLHRGLSALRERMVRND